MMGSLLNWPDAIERTPADEREDCTKFNTGLRVTRSDLKDQMRLLDVDEWRVEEVSGGQGDPGVVVRWIDDGQEYAAACDAYNTKTANLREAYMWIKETRMREQRPVSTAADNFAAAALPSGDDGEGIVVAEPDPHDVLGVEPGATRDEIKEAYRERVKEAHPDKGGSNAEVKRVANAYESLTDADGV